MATPIVPRTPVQNLADLKPLVNPSVGLIVPVAEVGPSATPPPALAGPIDPEAAANVILDLLPAYIAEYAREIAYVHNRQPLWAVVAGHLLKAYENGDLQAPLLDPSWPRKFTDLPVDPRTKVYVCEWKDGPKGTHEFAARRYRQRYCSNECGTAAAMVPPAPLAVSA